MTRHIAIATSTRADWGLLRPLADSLRDRGARVEVAATNMHLLPECGHTIDEIVADGYEPACIPATGTATGIMASALDGFGSWLASRHPDALIVLGDRSEILAVAAAAAACGVPIAHIAGGTVSLGATDDAFRHAITKLSTLHLVETEACRRRVIQMGEQPATVITTGAIGVDTFINALKDDSLPGRHELEAMLGIRLDRNSILATLHAATRDTVPPALRMQAMLDALGRGLDDGLLSSVLLTYPNNDVDPAPQTRLMHIFADSRPGRVAVVPSLGHARYLAALRHVGAVAGNSSSGIVEVPSAGIPTLDIGIRQLGRERAASVTGCEADAGSIFGGLTEIFTPRARALAAKTDNPYHRPGTLRLMTDAIMSYPFRPWPAKEFFQLSNTDCHDHR